MITVYADILVGVNVLITYLLIVSTRLVCKKATNKWGIAISSVIGGLSSLIIFFQNLPAFGSVLYKLVLAAVITGLAFLPESIKGFLKVLLTFFGISFLFGGVMYAVEITFNPENIIYLNGTVYFDMSLTYLAGSVLVIYGVFLVVNFLFERYTGKHRIFKVKIFYRGVEIALQGFADTGNNLSFGVSDRPVIIAELSAVAPLFSYEEIKYLKSGAYDDIPQSLVGKMHLVPCKTVTGDGFLPAIIPDKTEYSYGKKKSVTNFLCMAICDKKLSEGDYNVILHNSIFDIDWKERKDNAYMD